MALAALTARDRELLDRLSQSEPLSTSEVRLLFFSGVRVCRERLVKLEAQDLLLRVYPARSNGAAPRRKAGAGVTRRLWKVLDDNELTSSAIEQTYQCLTQRDGEHEAELAAVQNKFTETQTAMDRYFRAFENGTMPEDTCAPRLAALNEQAKGLQARASELSVLDHAERPQRATDDDLQALRNALRAALNNGSPDRSRPSSKTSPRKSA
jgi:hypothetical protein